MGLFLLGGVAASVALISWARSNAMRTGTPYLMTIELPIACGITIGTPVRIRGVQVGQVLHVKPSLERVDVLCEVNITHTPLGPPLMLISYLRCKILGSWFLSTRLWRRISQVSLLNLFSTSRPNSPSPLGRIHPMIRSASMKDPLFVRMEGSLDSREWH